MQWVIITLVMLSLLGSLMWIKPTPRQRMQAAMRLHAKQIGFMVQIARIETTRGKGEMEAEKISVPAYRILRADLPQELRDRWVSWQIFRVDNVADSGLPVGWSWKKGEGKLSAAALTLIRELIDQLPADVIALESSPVHFTVYWRERGDLATLDRMREQIQPILDARI
ncbi:hypothetical protein [Nitrincola alkalilacustris]|uniref:hypothetical protein n=1 Tax=Nitrincola alkalilacustris TaxID=1571224 RepID=UPI00124CAC98|nr:hypothetical protein [Nitrincola alkalilacustris]